MTDDEHDAWELHQSGLTWTEVGREMGCTAGTAQAFATAYQKRTDDAAIQAQNTLC
ncbi:hypothetical protein [Rhodococcus tibetensis]|uniref:Helix-turn-helix domain-containing protein n=1 Tax=Rhodococcus tibetensis TaxID=2965064 RepID=A0ABT1QBD9_9NOCA|nr:hypothetical protein [Rhodococcus sp. FXJ9.536]MCQ4119588.1 hypothetical protein [Rhodococcus sp. FXJ9.536]